MPIYTNSCYTTFYKIYIIHTFSQDQHPDCRERKSVNDITLFRSCVTLFCIRVLTFISKFLNQEDGKNKSSAQTKWSIDQ